MGDIIEFPSNGSSGQGYLALPQSGTGPGVLVIQEWWGLVDHIKDVCDRFAAEGFVALAPDLYRGEASTEPDEAGKLMMAMDIQRAARDIVGACGELDRRSSGDGIGVVGFCMGGGLALWSGTLAPDTIKAVVAFYGVIPWEAAQPDYSKMRAAVQGHYAENDDFAPPDSVRSLEKTLQAEGVEVDFTIYPGTSHAFFNDMRPEVYDASAAETAWAKTLPFLRSKLT